MDRNLGSRVIGFQGSGFRYQKYMVHGHMFKAKIFGCKDWG